MNETTIAYPGEEGFFGNLPCGKLMMWVFLASDVMGFASLIAGYFYLRMLSVDWPDSGELLNVMLTSINIDFELDQQLPAVRINASCKLSGQTGVEMEALTAVAVAALTIYDMCKGGDKNMVIEAICLREKQGGNSGHYRRTDDSTG